MSIDDDPEDVEVSIQLEAVLGSSHVASMGYDEASGVLVVEYQNGTRYQWTGIPPSAYLGLRGVGSVGRRLRQIEAEYGAGERIS